MSTDTPEVRPLPEAPKPPTLDDALSHLVYLGAVNVATFKEWATLNPGGVCVLIRALIARLPVTTQQYFPVYDSLNPPPTAPLAALPAKWRERARNWSPTSDSPVSRHIFACADELSAALAALAARAKGFANEDELIAFLDSLLTTDGHTLTGEKWPVAQRAIAGIRSASPADDAGVRVPDIDALAQFIRVIDGKHNLGAGHLAERILAFIAAPAAAQENAP